MNVLITGIAGFIGSHCLEYYLKATDFNIIGIDSFRHKGTHSRIKEFYENKRVQIFQHDLTCPIDRTLKNEIGPVDFIINLASDSAVERSLTNPLFCLKNNHELIINMLEYAREVKPKVFFQCSTDECYGDAPNGVLYREWSSIIPNNPYAASKACQESICVSYWRTFDVPVVITNTVNNFGEKQDHEKFLPTLIHNIYMGKTVPIYGDSLDKIGSRFYLYAKNHADAFSYLTAFEPGMYKNGMQVPDRYNVGCDEELTNLELAQLVAELLGKELKFELIPSETARKGYDRRYGLDWTKIKAKGWKPPFAFRESLEQVIKWTLEHPQWIF